MFFQKLIRLGAATAHSWKDQGLLELVSSVFTALGIWKKVYQIMVLKHIEVNGVGKRKKTKQRKTLQN